MSRERHPVTPAIRALRAAKVAFTPHLFDYVERGGTAHSAACLGVSEHAVIKTLIMEDDARRPLIALMHGDREVSTKALARHLGVKSVRPCEPKVADRHSGYRVGGTSPFGTKQPMPVYMQRSITDLEKIFINGGKRGFLVELAPQAVVDLLSPVLVEIEAGTD